MTGGEVIQVVRLVGSVLSKVRWVIEEDRKRNGKLADGLEFIQMELEMVNSAIQDDEDNQGAAVQETRMLQLQEFAYDVEDFIDGLWFPGASGPFLTAIAQDPRPQDLDRIDHFKELIKRLQEWQSRAEASQSGDTGEDSAATPTGGATNAPHPRKRTKSSQSGAAPLCGIDEQKRELLELLSVADGQPRQLRVISIVGCRGLGKTALARAVYDDPVVADAFDCIAWVEASGCNGADVLSKILLNVREGAGGTIFKKLRETLAEIVVNVRAGADGTTFKKLRDILADRRYMVVIDDMQLADVWNDIEHAFPRNDKSSRIIVTTSVQSIAATCSSAGYVYTMQGLGQAESKNLFWGKIGSRTNLSPALDDALQGTIDKCDGLPLALISSANYLLGQGKIEESVCEVVGKALGKNLAGRETDRAFQEMKGALVQCYGSLPDHGHRTCLLSLSMFPKGHLINGNSLVRRLVAGGLVFGDVQFNEEDVARECLKKLSDRSIIVPVLIGNNSAVKRCRVHGIMLEFIVHRSISRNFVTLIHKDKRLPKKKSPYPVRRLSVHDGTAESTRLAKETELSVVRWLTICNSDLLEFKTSRFLRVLDLEGCKGLDERVLEDICKLLFLKYLSLRGSDVNNIPQNINNLQQLETLDIRETQVEVLRMGVIMLPRLVHLFGKFELPDLPHGTRKPCALQTFFSETSSLQTLAGVVIVNEDKGFEQIMRHARTLKKVKICYKTSPPSNKKSWLSRKRKEVKCGNPSDHSLLLSLQERFTGSKALDSLSIDSSNLSQYFLRSLKAPCAIRSIKLRGELEGLPDSITLSELRQLKELHLVSTCLRSDALSELQSLPCLVCLKLAEDPHKFGDGIFVVRSGGFPSLERLCFEASKPPLPLVQIEERAMIKLTSLQLLCPEFADKLGVTGIEHLQSLNEVILHHAASDAVMNPWKEAAIQHKNRPYVKKQQIKDAAHN